MIDSSDSSVSISIIIWPTKAGYWVWWDVAANEIASLRIHFLPWPSRGRKISTFAVVGCGLYVLAGRVDSWAGLVAVRCRQRESRAVTWARVRSLHQAGTVRHYSAIGRLQTFFTVGAVLCSPPTLLLRLLLYLLHFKVAFSWKIELKLDVGHEDAPSVGSRQEREQSAVFWWRWCVVCGAAPPWHRQCQSRASSCPAHLYHCTSRH